MGNMKSMKFDRRFFQLKVFQISTSILKELAKLTKKTGFNQTFH